MIEGHYLPLYTVYTHVGMKHWQVFTSGVLKMPGKLTGGHSLMDWIGQLAVRR